MRSASRTISRSSRARRTGAFRSCGNTGRRWRRFTWELPAGLVERGEEPAEGCARELLEETGYPARAVHPLGHGGRLHRPAEQPHPFVFRRDRRARRPISCRSPGIDGRADDAGRNLSHMIKARRIRPATASRRADAGGAARLPRSCRADVSARCGRLVAGQRRAAVEHASQPRATGLRSKPIASRAPAPRTDRAPRPHPDRADEQRQKPRQVVVAVGTTDRTSATGCCASVAQAVNRSHGS